ncbi:MAG: hypothetical protein LC749_05010 [Actinobacteria bacterium]|nr:hypothetical protein [Actinomycetota bacterium]
MARKRGGLLQRLAFVVSVFLTVHRAWVALGLFLMLSLVLWISFFRRTICDVETKARNDGCGNPVRGRLRGCYLHRREKRDALCALLGLRNPGRRYRVMWTRPGSTYGRATPSPQVEEPHLGRPLYDGTMLVATIIGSLGTLAALAVQLHQL